MQMVNETKERDDDVCILELRDILLCVGFGEGCTTVLTEGCILDSQWRII